jgi:TolB-like protein/DNA-binding winged helix-turn-helix (wHTH) protein/Tfp pilus assembly protein PilF
MRPAATAYRFGPYELRVHSRELRKDGRRLKVRPQPFQVLRLLIERAPAVVTREELRESLWSPDTFVDFEHGLNTSIKELRGILGDSATEPTYIETVPKLGYRMVAAVEVEPAAAPVGPFDGSPVSVNSADLVERPQAPRVPSTTPWSAGEPRPLLFWKSWSARWSAVAVALALTIAVGLALSARSRSRTRAPDRLADGRIVMAVLPFENLTGDSAQEYFSDGITEEMISQLGRIDPKRLAVVARTSVIHYKGSRTPLDQIGRELGVQYVLEGSVRRDGGTLRIAAQLVEVEGQTQLWAREYDRQLSSLLSLQGEIAQEVADETELTLGQGERVSPPPKPRDLTPSQYEAYDLYLKGRYFWAQRTREGFATAVETFQQAIDKDSHYARAYAGLADAYALQSSYAFGPGSDIMPKARAAALKALQLDDSLAEAHASLALVAEYDEWDWVSAEREFRRAIELNPSYATAHQWYAEFLGFEGRFDEARAESDRARSLDPLSLIIVADGGVIDYFARRYDRAMEEFKSVLDLDPNVSRAYQIINACIQQRQFEEALTYTERLRQQRGVSDSLPWSWANEASIFGHSGDTARVQHALAELAKLKPSWPNEPTAMLSVAYIGAGRKEAALLTLEDAYRTHSNTLTALKVDPIYDPLRGDPRFQELLRRVRLAQ